MLSEKGLLEKGATIKRFGHPPLGSELKKQQTGIAKDQYKFFKDQINVDNNKRTFTYVLKDKDLHLINFENRMDLRTE